MNAKPPPIDPGKCPPCSRPAECAGRACTRADAFGGAEPDLSEARRLIAAALGEESLERRALEEIRQKCARYFASQNREQASAERTITAIENLAKHAIFTKTKE